MIYKILQTVPICPECQALMLKRYTSSVFYFCTDCKNILKVIESGKAENELIVTDGSDYESNTEGITQKP